MKTFALGIVEQMLNRYLQLDPEIGRWIAPLDMKTIAITLDGLSLTVYCYFGDERVYLMADCYTDADATIRGTPLALLGAKKDPQAAAAQGKITLEGDSDTIQAFHQLFQQLHIDWEGVLSRLCGDNVAASVGRVVRKAKRVGCASVDDMTSHLGEYLQHELNVLPPAQEITDFCNDVDDMRDHAERVMMRFAQQQGDL